MSDKKNQEKPEETMMIRTAGIMGIIFSILVAIMVFLWIEFPPFNLVISGLGGLDSWGSTLIFSLLFTGSFASLLIVAATLREYFGKIAGWIEVVSLIAVIGIIAQLMLANWWITGISLGLNVLFTYYLYKAQEPRTDRASR